MSEKKDTLQKRQENRNKKLEKLESVVLLRTRQEIMNVEGTIPEKISIYKQQVHALKTVYNKKELRITHTKDVGGKRVILRGQELVMALQDQLLSILEAGGMPKPSQPSVSITDYRSDSNED